ncbi:hypothetical protein GALMADRAFT_143299 [Galerina marginata CBS 339.88]|uniref:ATPase AAA-type core domain-containing protein n=1 Tax=Galerina marginata (strain CBS 339.88) TaxID=685588 RepID=A0A067SM47_GALM3|nr:hypothetical protein GALMADRAFT_143299 [Galerina marginata CBS 339.88]
MAGSGIQGQYEEEFKALIRDIKGEGGKVICFIDEVHTLFNLGRAEVSIDAGQLIKPALARGLQLVGATTRSDPRFWRSWSGSAITVVLPELKVQASSSKPDLHVKLELR